MAKKERKLTSGELERKAFFEAKEQELAKQGYEKKDLTITPIAANVLGIAIMVPIMVLFCWLFFSGNVQNIMFQFGFKEAIIFLIAILVLMVVHEGIHGLTWAIFAEGHLRSIRFGMIWMMLMPYCTCNAALTKAQYILGAMMPTVVVGFLPALVAISIDNAVLFFISLIMILGGGGDALIIVKLLLHKETRKSIYMDHPYECGIVVFEQTT